MRNGIFISSNVALVQRHGRRHSDRLLSSVFSLAVLSSCTHGCLPHQTWVDYSCNNCNSIVINYNLSKYL